jgi:hypothetical protein
LGQCRFRLGEPERHLHIPVHLDRCGQLGVSLFPLSRLGVYGTETQVAVRLQRVHIKFVGQGKSLAVASVGLFDFWEMALRRDLAEEAQCPRLVAALLMLAADFNRMPGLVQGVFKPSGSQVRFAQRDNAKHMVRDDPHGGGLLHHLFQQRQGLGHTSGQDICCT